MYKLIRYFQRATILAGVLVTILIALPLAFGIKPYVVLSGSMEPKVKTGSIAYINTKVPVESINKYDIIGFNAGGNMIVTHRVVDISSDGFTTKGDANQNNDEKLVKYSSYIGKNVFSIPYIGRVVAYFRTSTGIFWLTAIIGLNILCTLYDKTIYKEDYEESESTEKANTRDKFGKDNEISENAKLIRNSRKYSSLTPEEKKHNLQQMYDTLLEKTANTKSHAFENFSPEQKEKIYQEMYYNKNETEKLNIFKEAKKRKGFFTKKSGKHAKQW